MENQEPVTPEVENDQFDDSVGDESDVIESNEEPENTDEVENVDDEPEDDSDKSIDDLPLPNETESSSKKELPKWLKNKIAKKERELAQKEAEANRYREELEKANQSLPINNLHDGVAPRREDFDSDDDYIDARYAYNKRKDEIFNQQKQKESAIIAAEVEFQKKLNSALDSGSQKYEDFDERTEVLFQPNFPNNRAMAQAIVDSDYKDDILYFLGTYSEKAKQIAKMNPVQAIKEIAKLETRFAEKKRSNVTKASKPLKPLNSNKGNTVSQDPSKMDPETFNKWFAQKYGR